MTEPRRRLGRPSDPGKLDAILDAGWQLFLARGFEAVTVEAIAAEAGVSRVTLYKHFRDKAALFEAAVLRATERIEAEQAAMGSGGDGSLAGRLGALGVGLMTFLGSPTAVAFYSVRSGELRRHPAVARAFYDLGPARTLRNLGAILTEAKTRGEIAIDEPERAAEMLVGLWQGMSNYRLALGVDPESYGAELVTRVREGVALFLRGCERRE